MATFARIHRALLIATILAGCSSNTKPTPNQDLAGVTDQSISSVCSMIADKLAEFDIRATVEANLEECMVDGSTAVSSLSDKEDPVENLRFAMVAGGWSEETESRADGPGTTAFRLILTKEYCEIEAGAPAWIDDDDGIRQPDEYFVTAKCGRMP